MLVAGRAVLTECVYSYLHAYEMVRGITGIGEGNGPIITIHDGFSGPGNWANFLPGADRVALGE